MLLFRAVLYRKMEEAGVGVGKGDAGKSVRGIVNKVRIFYNKNSCREK